MNLNLNKLRQIIEREIEKEKEAHPFVHQYQDAQGHWHVFKTNIYDWEGAIPIVSNIQGDKVKIQWVKPGSAWQTLYTTKSVVYDPQLKAWVSINLYNKLHKQQIKQPDLTPEQIKKLNEMNEGKSVQKEQEYQEYIVRGWKDGKSVEFKTKSEEEAWKLAAKLKVEGYNYQVQKPEGAEWKYAGVTPFIQAHPDFAQKLKEMFRAHEEERKNTIKIEKTEQQRKIVKQSVFDDQMLKEEIEKLKRLGLRDIDIEKIVSALKSGKSVSIDVVSGRLPSLALHPPMRKEVKERVEEKKPEIRTVGDLFEYYRSHPKEFEKKFGESLPSKIEKWTDEETNPLAQFGKTLVSDILLFPATAAMGLYELGSAVKEAVEDVLFGKKSPKRAGEDLAKEVGEMFEVNKPAKFAAHLAFMLAPMALEAPKVTEIKPDIDIGKIKEIPSKIKEGVRDIAFGKVEVELKGVAKEAPPIEIKPKEVIRLKPQEFAEIVKKAEIPPESMRYGKQMSLEGVEADVKALEEFKKRLVERRVQEALKERLVEEGIIEPEEIEEISLKPIERKIVKPRSTILLKEKIKTGEYQEIPVTSVQVTLPEESSVEAVKVRRGLFGVKKAKVVEKLSKIEPEIENLVRFKSPVAPQESKAYLDVFTPKKTVQLPLPITEEEQTVRPSPDLTWLAKRYEEDLAKSTREKWENAEILELSESGEVAKVRFRYKGKGRTYTFEELVPIEEIPEEVWTRYEKSLFEPTSEELAVSEGSAKLITEEKPIEFEIVREEEKPKTSAKEKALDLFEEKRRVKPKFEEVKGKSKSVVLLIPKLKEKEKEKLQQKLIESELKRLKQMFKVKTKQKLKLKIKSEEFFKQKIKQMQKFEVGERYGLGEGVAPFEAIKERLGIPLTFRIGEKTALKIGTPPITSTALKLSIAPRTALEAGSKTPEPRREGFGIPKPFGGEFLPKRKPKSTEESDLFRIGGKKDIVPLADWLAVTVTQAFTGKAGGVVRTKRKKQYVKRMKEMGFALTFPTEFIERKKIKTPLDVEIEKSLKILDKLL